MKNNYTAVILAGGKNSRMGTEKGLLLVNGITIIERIINVLKPIVDDIIIITNGTNYDYLGYKTYKDIYIDCGPMGGIYTALNYSNTAKNFVVSCDMPFISNELVQFIIDNSAASKIAIPLHHEKLEPLCAIYDKICQFKLEELLKNKEWKLMDSLKHFQVKKISIPENILKGNCFANINTPDDYEKVKSNKHDYFN